ncbi:MAG TPA: prolipoprotein diacylglyceryl transferase [Thermoanaerobaculia bacterium]|nr:prolipoprotein diacylglyceryl transferase [Thermoanaerobaculia bacterium]
MHPELIRIGSFALPSYGLMMALGFLAALWLVRKRAPAFGVAPDVASDIGIWVLLSGLVGSKLLLVIVDWPQYVSSWSGLRDLARAGGVFYGGLMGAVVATAVLLRRREIPFFKFADIAAPSVALGQCLGRVGCLLAGCCWGRICALPWAITFTDQNAHDNVGVPLNFPLHPTQIYEALGTLALCVLLIVLERRRYSGETFVRYLFGYALLRFTIELFRGDPRGSVFGLMSTSQFIALCGVAAAAVLWALRRRTASAPAAA